jgi:hypothetical protein
MKNILIVCVIFSLTEFRAQTQKLFPSIDGHLLNDKNIHIPQKNQKYSIVAIAYNRDAEYQLKEWLNPLYNVFIKKEKGAGQMDMAELFDVNFVFIPLISGFKKVEEDFKDNTDKEFWPYIMDTEKTDIKGLQKELSVDNTKIPYFYVLNPEGKIVEVQSGKFSEAKLDKLEDAIE